MSIANQVPLPTLEVLAIAELAKDQRWVCAELPSKRPLQVTGKPASVTDSTTWSTCEDVYAAYVGGTGDALGYVLGDGIVGIDLDHCIRDDGSLEPWASKIVNILDSYTEISQSGRGLHILIRASFPKGVTGRRRGQIEIYADSRYFIITGQVHPGSRETIEERQEALDALLLRVFTDRDASPCQSHERQEWDGQLPTATANIAKAEPRVARLLHKPFSELGFPSDSEVDLSLANVLASAGLPGEEIEASLRWRRQEVGAKKKHSGYYEMTVGKALATQGARDAADETSVALIASDNANDSITDTSFASNASFAPVDTAPSWPEPLGEAAYHGIAGEFVRLVAPHTEADPAALLSQFLTHSGNVIGRSSYFVAEADRHYTNIFVTLVGETSKGRKGTSHGQVLARSSAVDSTWSKDRIMSGLSSGEGLIWQVRDEIIKREHIKEKGRVVGYEDVIADPGVDDKRLLVFESELASTLRVLDRDGNKLSAIIRQAWDLGDLRTLTKHTPAKATGAHISIVGHITISELRRYLDRTEVGNGFANRFLWICVRRANVLPEGGELHTVDFADFQKRLTVAVEHARKAGELRRDEEARALWCEVYEKLSEGRPGLLGAVTSRAEAQVMRLACIYALLDCDNQIGLPHLQAALEVWRYANDSARYIFGNDLGDPVADEILRALRANLEGLTRTQIHGLFSRHNSEGVGRALGSLHGLGLAHSGRDPSSGGRQAERWYAGPAKEAKEAKEGKLNGGSRGKDDGTPAVEAETDDWGEL